MIWIYTVDGRRTDTRSLSYEDAMTALRDPDGVLDVEVEKSGGVYPTAIPVRSVVRIERY